MIMLGSSGSITTNLQQEIGNRLRAVAEYDHQEYELHHLRADLTDAYSTDDLIDGLNQVEIEGLGYSHFERLFKTGRMECAIYRFEEAMMYHFPVSEFTGLFVTVDRNGDPNTEKIISTCLTGLCSDSN